MDEPNASTAAPEAGADRPVDGPPPPLPPPGTAETDGGRWQLRRSLRDRKLKGVAGGVAAAADLDPTLVRLLFAVAAFSGWGIVAYIVLAVVVQDETVDGPARALPRDQRRLLRIGLGVAAFVAVGRLFDGWFFRGGDIGLPFVLIAVGAAVLWARRDQSPVPAPAPAGEPGWPDPGGPDVPPAAWPAAPMAPPLGGGVDWRATGHDLLRLAAAFVAVGAFVALVGVGFLVVVGAVPMRLPFLPAAVAVVGLLGLVVAVVRRTRPAGLFVFGGALVAAVALAAGMASFPDGAGSRTVVIGPGTPLLASYEHGAGELVLDLGGVVLEPGAERRVVAEVGAGQLTVIVPPALTTTVAARVGAGDVELFGRGQGGPGVEMNARRDGTAGAGRLDLDLDVGVGEIKVVLQPEPTFEVTCQVPPEAIGDGTDTVSCPHPARLSGTAMSCSVALVDPDAGSGAGRAFCRRQGALAPAIGVFAASCRVPAESDIATCDPLSRSRLTELDGLRASQLADRVPGGPAAPASPEPPFGPTPTAPPTTASRPGAGGAPLSCGLPDPAGTRLCTTVPTVATSTTVAVTYRCTEDPVTEQLACTPA